MYLLGQIQNVLLALCLPAPTGVQYPVYYDLPYIPTAYAVCRRLVEESNHERSVSSLYLSARDLINASHHARADLSVSVFGSGVKSLYSYTQ